MAKGERAFVDWLRGRMTANRLRAPIGIGDDMAALRAARGIVLVTADMLMDGVDFRSAEHTPEQIGRKALAASLSDCAAMAVRPLAAIVSVALPEAWSMEQAQGLVAGMEPLVADFNCPLVGGDTNSWKEPLVIDAIVIAEPYALWPAVTRSGARVGDGLYVSGPLGGSLAGRHLTFTPRVREARALREAVGEWLHAMIDISDGLALDAYRLCEASGVGGEFDEAVLAEEMIHPDAVRLSQSDGRTALDHALHDGEDFELLAAIAESSDVIDAPPGRWRRIGRVVERGLALVRPDAGRVELEPRGWEHFR